MPLALFCCFMLSFPNHENGQIHMAWLKDADLVTKETQRWRRCGEWARLLGAGDRKLPCKAEEAVNSVGRGLCVVLLQILAHIIIQAHSSSFLGTQRSLGEVKGAESPNNWNQRKHKHLFLNVQHNPPFLEMLSTHCPQTAKCPGVNFFQSFSLIPLWAGKYLGGEKRRCQQSWFPRVRPSALLDD